MSTSGTTTVYDVTTPGWLCRSVAVSVPADAVTITLVVDEVRLPVAASSPAAATAERVEFTVGDGPGLDAVRQQRVVTADEPRLARRWPELHHQLTGRTPVRSMAAVPLFDLADADGSLDLYWNTPHGVDALDLQIATRAAAAVAAMLASASASWTTVLQGLPSGPSWLDRDTLTRRAHVWIALGVITATLGSDQTRALELIRGYAARAGFDLDAVTAALLDGSIDPAQL